MKTRIIKTKFWTDNIVLELPPKAKLLFIYLLSSQHIGLSGILECSDLNITFYTGLDDQKLDDAKRLLEDAGRVYFYQSWMWVVNAERHNRYRNGPANEQAYQNELSHIPSEVREYFDGRGYSSPPSTHKPTTRNQNNLSDKAFHDEVNEVLRSSGY